MLQVELIAMYPMLFLYLLVYGLHLTHAIVRYFVSTITLTGGTRTQRNQATGLKRNSQNDGHIYKLEKTFQCQ
jgi:hypothetical protein